MKIVRAVLDIMILIAKAVKMVSGKILPVFSKILSTVLIVVLSELFKMQTAFVWLAIKIVRAVPLDLIAIIVLIVLMGLSKIYQVF